MKQIAGTIRPGRDRPEPEFPLAEHAEPPDWVIGLDALAEWARLVPLLQATRVLTEDNLSALGHLCNLHGACVQLYRASLAPDAAKLTQLRLYYAEFGLTPASRSRAGKVGEDGKKNPFQNLA